jgi:hypothetical protein
MPATQLQLRRGNTTQITAFTGAIGEATYDTERKTIVVHDGSTVGGSVLAKASDLSANAVIAQGAYDKANSANVLAQSGYNQANTATTTAGLSYNHANGAFDKANTATTTADAGFAKANSANVIAQAAFDNSNTKFSSSGGSISGDVSVTGNLTVVGQTVYANTTTVLIADNVLTLNAAINQASAPTVNAGVEVDRGSSANVSLLWNESSDKWTFTNDGSTYYDIADAARLDSSFTHANSAFNQANTATTTAGLAYNHANGAFDNANTANTRAYNTVLKSGDTMTGVLNITNTTSSISNTTGALIVSGGVGVLGNVSVGAIIFPDATVQTTASGGGVGGYFNSSIQSFPTTNTDLGQGENYVGEISGADFSGISIFSTFYCGDPVGSLQSTDLGSIA